MYCYQCEQTQQGSEGPGCRSAVGTCGKDALTADLQDLLIYLTKGISMYAHRASQLGVVDSEVNGFVLDAMFSTLTNVNFDAQRFEALIQSAAKYRDQIKTAYEAACASAGQTPDELTGPATCNPEHERAALQKQAELGAITVGLETVGEDIVGLRALVLYGLKGVAAYADHARILGEESNEVYATFHEAMDFLASDPTDLSELLGWALKTGELNYKVMELLDAGGTGRYGHPVPTEARTTPVKGQCILVSGHDMVDLEAVLQQTEGTGINVYTHGELLPAHGYPALQKYAHLKGNYGTAWQRQKTEFAEFPGSILMTSNCIIEPMESYQGRIFTSGPVGWPGVAHVEDHDYSGLIAAAKAQPGFTEDAEPAFVTVGFARNAVLGVADKVVEAVKQGQISHFFVIGGCDGARPGRNYYSEVAEAVPDDGVILTLGCAKYRFNDHDFGDIGGIPRLLDVGQCNDTYSAIQIALALADAFDCGVNDLPLSLVISWLEQKAVAVLLTLLFLGIKDIRLGPTLPSFVSPAALDILVEEFGLTPIGNAREDMQAMLQAS